MSDIYVNLSLVRTDDDIVAVYTPRNYDLEPDDEVDFELSGEMFEGIVIKTFFTGYKDKLWQAVAIATEFEPVRALSVARTSHHAISWDEEEQEGTENDTV